MRALGRFLLSVWFIIPLVTLILSICIWLFSPYIGNEAWRPFDGLAGRAVFVGVLWVLALGTMLTIFLVRRARARRLESEIMMGAGTDAAGQDAVVTAELSELRDKLRGAMAKLRKSKGGRRQLYELPWYVMIGPPGAGKTTAIVNSGLQFPLADDMGKSAIGGVGGTRNCDWWFTDSAVLIDTAGRYTTQESDADADNAAWLGFLNLLKRHRKRQPINGAMIAISLSDLSLQDETTQRGHARAVRRRLHELREKLGVRFPVYVLFTKADLIAGFTEFFDGLGKEEREQVWGFTLPLDTTRAEASPIGAFDAEFAGLLGQLNAQCLERMQAETDHQRRSLVAGFPSQVASVRSVARTFLQEVFQDSRFEERHMLRGVYFTSGTQEGTPIDRLMMGMARTFGIGRQAIGSGRGSGRSFFLTRLFEGVIFPEAGLVSADDKVERRYRWSKRAAIAATILLAIAAGALWTRSYLGNQQLLATVQGDLVAYQAAAAAIPGSPVGDTDLPAIVDALNTLRALPVNPIPARFDASLPGPSNPPRALTWGLYQGGVIANQAGQTYRAALNQHLLPRVLLRLEEQIQGNMNNAELLYEALRIYLMLGLQGPVNAAQISEWMQIDWSMTYPGAAREDLRRDLAHHLEALLNQPMRKVDLNGPLVEQVQDILAAMPLAERVYSGIINSPAATALPTWRITEIGGPAVSRAFARSSGKPLNEGIEGIFTLAGFNDVFLDEAVGVAERIQRDSWVLGPMGEAAQTEMALAALSRDVLALYYSDYISRYDQILGDLDIIPLESLSQAVEVTTILSGPTSPIVNILNAVATQTRLTGSADPSEPNVVADEMSRIAVNQAINTTGTRTRMLLRALQSPATGPGAATAAEPGADVENRFAWLHELLDRPDGQASQLDLLMLALTDVYQELNTMSFRSGTTSGGLEGQALTKFQQAASRTEGPLQRWATQITVGSSGISAEGNRAAINARWKAQVLPVCEQSIANRYPFDRRAAADVGMQDFQRLFAPGGLIDAFFTENLASKVDMSTRPWSWLRVNDTELGISDAVLHQFQAAAEIRDAFFATGPAPGITFQITPEALDVNAAFMFFEVDGQPVEFAHNRQPLPVAITWPGTVGLARVGFEPQLENAESRLVREGSWGLFRLLDSAVKRDTTASDRKRLLFNIGGRVAIFQLQTGSAIDPFSLEAFENFSCPTSF